MWILWSWQVLPAYFLMVVAALFPARLRKTRIVVLGLLGFLALSVWVILPMPRLAKPDGTYSVGTSTFRWVDESRPETATDDPNDKRNVILQIFYPAAKGATGKHPVYLDGIHNLPPYVSIMPRFLLRNFDKVETHSTIDAPVSGDRQRWPVVIFSPGYGSPRSFYTSLLEGLASRGIAVLAIDHPYEAGVAELADGRVVGNVIRRPPNDPDLIGYMTSQQAIRVADIRFALDQIMQLPLALHLDTSHITAAGHSFGGASSMSAMDQDVRITAAVNIDGTPYGSLPDQHLNGPVMLIGSDPVLGHHSERYRTGNQKIMANLSGASGYRYSLSGTNHYSFTDFPLFFTPPGRWLLSLVIGGSRNPHETYRATLDLLSAFPGDPAKLEAIVSRHQDITGGRVR